MRKNLVFLFAPLFLVAAAVLTPVVPAPYFESATLLVLGSALLTAVAGHRWIKKHT